jgi:hypothetical protein
VTAGVFFVLAASLAPAVEVTPEARPTPASKPTFCVEWVRQSREGYERITLFRDRSVVWKTVAKTEAGESATNEVRRKTLAPEEVDFYCTYFARPEFWELSEDLRTGLTGEFTSQSSVTFTRPDGARKRLRFDELSALSAGAAALRSALEGIRTVFTNPLAPASRFTADAVPPGTILKRFDGAVFRVVRLEKESGFVEIKGVSEPYSQFVKLEELRFQFSPPE